MNQCKRCGYNWTSRTKNPKCCPKCKSYFFDKPIVKDGEVVDSKWKTGNKDKLLMPKEEKEG